jgi:sporulation protein YlmC with PRC-barrel domain
MGEIAAWVAPIATAIAAMMTASNLGTRITGWGFVLFTIGSLAWITEAVATHQTNLLLTNAFLTLVNIVGIWRWLGRQATYDKGARAAEADSEEAGRPDLFQLGGLLGKTVTDRSGKTLGHVVDAMAECVSGRISYLVLREGSEATIGERLHALPWKRIRIDQESVRLADGAGLRGLPEIDPAHWPAGR